MQSLLVRLPRTPLVSTSVRCLAGHSKWKTIQHKKGAQDAKKSAQFAKIGQQLRAAAASGGSDAIVNQALAKLVSKATGMNMPKENIEKAIAKGVSTVKGERMVYEGYAPGGVALMVQTATDNRNRTAQQIRHIFTKNGASLGAQGSVAWKFTPYALLTVTDVASKDEFFEKALEMGADDIEFPQETEAEILVPPADHVTMREKLRAAKFDVDNGHIVFRAKEFVSVANDEVISNIEDMLEELEEMPEVSDVSHDCKELLEE